MAKKSGLGGNYSSIFDDKIDLFGEESDEDAVIQTLKITAIEPNREQPRKAFDPEKLNALAESIAENGLIQPLTVRRLETGEYQIVAGERRWRAAKIAGLTEVPVRVMELTDQQTMQIALIENLQREDLNPIEEALGYQELMNKFNMKQDEVAKKMGRARSSIANTIRLLSLPDEVKQMVVGGEISGGHCKALLSVEDKALAIALAKRVVTEGMSVRALEALLKKTPKTSEKREPPKKNQFFAEAEISLANCLGRAVRISEGKNKRTLEIDFSSEDELKEIIHRLAGE